MIELIIDDLEKTKMFLPGLESSNSSNNHTKVIRIKLESILDLSGVNIDLNTVVDLDDGVGKFLSIVYEFGLYILSSFRVIRNSSSITSECPGYLMNSMPYTEQIKQCTQQKNFFGARY